MATEQLAVPFDVPDADPVDPSALPTVTLDDGSELSTISGEGFEVVFDKTRGTLATFTFGGTPLLVGGPLPNFWRAPLDNDRGNGMPSRLGTWRVASNERTVDGVVVTQPSAQVVRVDVDFTLPTTAASTLSVSYTVFGSGDIVVDTELTPGADLPELPEFGMLMTVPGDLEQLSWYGRGPQENYWDRNTGARVGVYSGTVDEQFFPYIRPQETGNKTDVRWATLTNEAGTGLGVFGSSLVEINALHYPPGELESKLHPYELERSEDITLRLNHRQMGVGGDDSWGARPHPEFTLPGDQPYTFRFRLAPISSETPSAMELEKQRFVP